MSLSRPSHGPSGKSTRDCDDRYTMTSISANARTAATERVRRDRTPRFRSGAPGTQRARGGGARTVVGRLAGRDRGGEADDAAMIDDEHDAVVLRIDAGEEEAD